MRSGTNVRAAARTRAVALLCAGVGIAHPDAAEANSPSALRAKYGALQDSLSHNQFRRPLYLHSSETPHYLQVTLYANDGPLSTRDYRGVLEAVALENAQTFIHLSYSFGYGVVGRLAMQAYLGTIGRSKVGFTVDGTQPDGAKNMPHYARQRTEKAAREHDNILNVEMAAGSQSTLGK